MAHPGECFYCQPPQRRIPGNAAHKLDHGDSFEMKSSIPQASLYRPSNQQTPRKEKYELRGPEEGSEFGPKLRPGSPRDDRQALKADEDSPRQGDAIHWFAL
jgi:hypothetical protein